MKKFIGTAVAALFIATPAMAQQLPPAKPGECYAKVLIPASYKTTSDQVLIAAGSSKMARTAAVYKTVEKRVLIAEESFELELVPAVYETVTEAVLLKPEEKIKTLSPPKYGNKITKVLVTPAHDVWKVGRGLFEKIDTSTGEIMCRVTVPAVYKDVTTQVEISPASTGERIVPAKYTTIKRQVMKSPPKTIKKVIPAVYKTVSIEELVTPESIVKTDIAPVYKSVSKRSLLSPEVVQWREVLCETNTTPGIISNIQKALNSKGYKISTIDGDFGPATRNAVAKFQKDNNLPTGGLTISTVRALGL